MTASKRNNPNYIPVRKIRNATGICVAHKTSQGSHLLTGRQKGKIATFWLTMASCEGSAIIFATSGD